MIDTIVIEEAHKLCHVKFFLKGEKVKFNCSGDNGVILYDKKDFIPLLQILELTLNIQFRKEREGLFRIVT